MRGTFLACWISFGLTFLHLLIGQLKYKHWVPFLRLCVTFGSAFAAVSISFVMWPIISTSEVKTIVLSGEILLAIWLGTIASVAVPLVALYENAREMRKAYCVLPTEKKPDGTTSNAAPPIGPAA